MRPAGEFGLFHFSKLCESEKKTKIKKNFFFFLFYPGTKAAMGEARAVSVSRGEVSCGEGLVYFGLGHLPQGPQNGSITGPGLTRGHVLP